MLQQDTVQPNEFRINWPCETPNGGGMATDKEIRSALKRLAWKVNSAKPGAIVNVTLRTQVAKTVMEGINKTGTACAAMDVGSAPEFIPKEGDYRSELYVAPNSTVMDHFRNHY